MVPPIIAVRTNPLSSSSMLGSIWDAVLSTSLTFIWLDVGLFHSALVLALAAIAFVMALRFW